MYPLRSLVFFFILIGSFHVVYGQNELPPNTEVGQCYAKCYVQPLTKIHVFQLPIYLGDDSSSCQDYVKDTSFLIQDAMVAWKRILTDTTCRSAHSDDCFVWRLIDQNEIYYDLESLVIDTMACKEFILETFEYIELLEEGTFSEYREVLCKKYETSDIVLLIQEKLFEKGYLRYQDINGTINGRTKSALESYQHSHELPVGNLNIETLEHLGVDYQ